MTETLYDKLSKRFPEEAEKTLTKSGTRLTYVPQAEVVSRLNQVFGVQGWTSQILSVVRDKDDPDWVLAHVRLTATVMTGDGAATFSRDGVGGQKIKKTKNGDIVDLGDEFKGAVSDALKKAATQFGVGLYLARDEDAMEVEDLERANRIPETVQVGWDALLKASRDFTADEKAKLKDRWNQIADAGTKMIPQNITEDQISSLLELAEEISMAK